jgi:PIN domain nuclease of toxin-antitoxin system
MNRARDCHERDKLVQAFSSCRTRCGLSRRQNRAPSASHALNRTRLGKLTLRKPLEEFLPEQLATNRFTLLNIAAEHAFRLVRLPLHHRDPFDRMLVAQCLAENLPLVSSDDAPDAYGIKRLW